MLEICPLSLAEANAFVEQHHRHHKPVVGHKFSMLSTRHGKQYSAEMTDADHAELLEALKRHIGPVLISGYDHPLYTEPLDGWHRRQTTTTDQKARVRQECLWMNFDPPGQTSLFINLGGRL